MTELKAYLKHIVAVGTDPTWRADAGRRVARRLLTGALIVVYFLLVTPVALVRRAFGGSLVHPGRRAGRGWQPIRQSSSDKQIYSDDF